MESPAMELNMGNFDVLSDVAENGVDQSNSSVDSGSIYDKSNAIRELEDLLDIKADSYSHSSHFSSVEREISSVERESSSVEREFGSVEQEFGSVEQCHSGSIERKSASIEQELGSVEQDSGSVGSSVPHKDVEGNIENDNQDNSFGDIEVEGEDASDVDLDDLRPPSDDEEVESILDDEEEEELANYMKEKGGRNSKGNRKRHLSSSSSGSSSSSSSAEQEEDSSDSEGKEKKKKKKRKRADERRNIRKILSEDQLDAETRAAQQEEQARKQRLMELRESLIQAAIQAKHEEQQRQHSELKSLLEDQEKAKEAEVIVLDDESNRRQRLSEDRDVIEVISSDEENDVVMVPAVQEEEDDPVDPNNSGSHINDELNQKDALGRVLINVGHPSDEPDIYLAPQLARAVKPHQIGGIRFLYDNLVESLSRFKTSNGFGCILAHSMGLGKTIQVITFIDIFLRHTTAKTVLCIVPINTLQNWLTEFNMWLPTADKLEGVSPDNVLARQFHVHMVNDNHKTMSARSKVVEEWRKKGGVLLMGYEMYRLLSSRRVLQNRSRRKKPANAPPEIIDLEEEDKNKELLSGIHKSLMQPGPDLVICDEGHRIKNSHASISQALKNIRTRRRVVLTGYPLQNNLLEYWCMVDFVRPNYLGTKTEFCNMFERPIMNGQCQDSTPQDARLMKFRAHVLHSLLEGFVQRRGHTVLRASLPPKSEHVLLVRMSPSQRQLYNAFMVTIKESGLAAWASNNPIKAFSVCCKIWNHPDILHQTVEERKITPADDNDLDIDTETTNNTGKKPRARKKKEPKSQTQSPVQSQFSQEDGLFPFPDRREQQVISYEWAEDLMKDYKKGMIEHGGKIVILMSLIEETLLAGDKLLVFSQSLFTLNLIEEYLAMHDIPLPQQQERWAKNKSYFRLDGSTSSQERDKLINQFNAKDNNKVHLFLLSTRAGCLGINLVGANRVVVMDASWNPCHDCQAVCRVYRYGQTKQCYVYRLVTDNCMEKRIYERQVNKQGMSDRVVDELQPQNHFTKKQVDTLLHYEDFEPPIIDPNCVESIPDTVLRSVLRKQHRWMTREPFTHESLLIDRQDQKLTKAEKRLAKQGYEMEKKLNVSYSRPSYAAFYPKNNMPPANYMPVPPSHIGHSYSGPAINKRPVASVRPMISTPIPMQPKQPPGWPALGSNLKPGVTVQQVQTTKDIIIPGTSTSVDSRPNKIPAGETVQVIKTMKGVYLRTAEGKIFAVRTGQPGGAGSVPEDSPTGQDISSMFTSAADGPKTQSGDVPKTSPVTNISVPSAKSVDRSQVDISRTINNVQNPALGPKDFNTNSPETVSGTGEKKTNNTNFQRDSIPHVTIVPSTESYSSSQRPHATLPMPAESHSLNQRPPAMMQALGNSHSTSQRPPATIQALAPNYPQGLPMPGMGIPPGRVPWLPPNLGRFWNPGMPGQGLVSSMSSSSTPLPASQPAAPSKAPSTTAPPVTTIPSVSQNTTLSQSNHNLSSMGATSTSACESPASYLSDSPLSQHSSSSQLTEPRNSGIPVGRPAVLSDDSDSHQSGSQIQRVTGATSGGGVISTPQVCSVSNLGVAMRTVHKPVSIAPKPASTSTSSAPAAVAPNTTSSMAGSMGGPGVQAFSYPPAPGLSGMLPYAQFPFALPHFMQGMPAPMGDQSYMSLPMGSPAMSNPQLAYTGGFMPPFSGMMPLGTTPSSQRNPPQSSTETTTRSEVSNLPTT